MSWRTEISVSSLICATVAATGMSMGLAGLAEAIYLAPSQAGVWMYGTCLYVSFGLCAGLVWVLLFGGPSRNKRSLFEQFVARTARIPAAFTALFAGSLIVWRDVCEGRLSGLLGWPMVSIPILAAFLSVFWVVTGWLARFACSRSVRSCVIATVAAVAGLLATAGGHEPPPLVFERGNREKSPGVILVVADSLRADVLGIYGANPTPSANLDDFAGSAVVFSNAWATASWTRPSVASILTGRMPSEHGVVRENSRLPEGIETLASGLAGAGWNTAAIVANHDLAPPFGLGRGFATYAYLGPEPALGAPAQASSLFLVEAYRFARLKIFSGTKAPEDHYAPGDMVNRLAFTYLERLASAGRPFFLYLHFMEPHEPYFAHPLDGTAVAREDDPSPPPESARQFKKLYLQEVRYWDGLLGALVERIEKLDLADRTMVIITSDHGEEFGEHGGFWHGTTLYEELVRAPLVMKVPGRHARAETRPVSLLDIFPSVLSFAGISTPEGLEGVSLLDEGLVPAGRVLRAEVDCRGCSLRAVRYGRYKLIRSLVEDPRGQPEWQLFDLEADRAEKNDLAKSNPDTLERMKKLMEGAAPSESDGSGGIDAEKRSDLEKHFHPPEHTQ